ncbi:MAG TPA: glucoamylase family protein [Saprospiraceae bacterium]|nr:glucoamylase family protein [Saprospiraceae bacterium]
MLNFNPLNHINRGGIVLPDLFLGTHIRLILLGFLFLVSCKTKVAPPVQEKFVEYSIDEVERRTFNYFWETADTNNYQIPDRYPTLTFSSIAATGFGLSAYIVGSERHYVTREEAANRTLKTLQVLWRLPQGPGDENVSGYKGFFYHFLTLDRATRFKDVELSSIDSGLLMAGILSSMSYFDQDNETERLIRMTADSLFRRVEWNWMMNDSNRMWMGFHPEEVMGKNHGFIPAEWKGYNEAMVLLIMAMGSPTYPVSGDAWKKWCSTYTWATFEGQDNIQFDPLFGHQYSHVWIDFRNIQDDYIRSKGIDYFGNSMRATMSNRAYCIRNPLGAVGYNENCWGLTACDGPYNTTMTLNGKEWKFFDYRARGACSIQVVDDGTIAPTAAGGSYAFTPDLSDAALKYMWTTYYHDLVGEYGFKDAFNLTYVTDEHPNGWFDIDYLGIDQGPILLMIENHRTGLIWEVMKKNPYIIAGLKKAGFKGGYMGQ